VNAHTSANPGGEIRGQVLMASGAGFAVKLDGSQEVPPVTTNASATASVILNPNGTVTFDETVTGMTPTAAHFHNGAAGVSAGVVKNTTLTNNTASGTWSSSDATQTFTDVLLRELVKGRLYLNVHSSTNPGGEIRGQVIGSTGLATSVERVEQGEIPNAYRLDQNYPNPFNPKTAISYQLTISSFVNLEVFDVLGRKVSTLVNEVHSAGSHTVHWDGSTLPSGVYYYRLQARESSIIGGSQATESVLTKKMVLLK
jgi:hypothetical protein